MAEFFQRGFAWLWARLGFVLPLLCVLVYLPALHHDFVQDDQYLIVGNPYIKDWKHLPRLLIGDIWNVSEPGNYWRPVFSVSLALDYSIWGLNPLGFHLTNILLHAINTGLLFAIVKKLQGPTSALFACLLFAFHPIQAHAVNVVSVRGDLLAALFTLLSLETFSSRGKLFFALALGFALLSKETSIFLPLALLLARIVIPMDNKESKLLLAGGIFGLYLIARLSFGFSFSLLPLIFSYSASTAERLLLVFKVLSLYFVAIFNLFEMPHPFWTVEIPNSLLDPHVLAGMSIFLFLLALTWRTLRGSPLIAFGLAWFLVYFLPISNLKQLNQPMAEHWLYIPMIGLSIGFGAAMRAVSLLRLSWRRLVRLGITTGVVGLLFLAVLVIREKTKIYRDDESFLIAAIRANPQIARLYSLLGNVYVGKQDIPRAKEFYSRSLKLDAGEFVANYTLGVLLYKEGKRDEASPYLRKVASIEPLRRVEFPAVAYAWEMLGDRRKALFYFRRALDFDPESSWVKERISVLENR